MPSDDPSITALASVGTSSPATRVERGVVFAPPSAEVDLIQLTSASPEPIDPTETATRETRRPSLEELSEAAAKSAKQDPATPAQEPAAGPRLIPKRRRPKRRWDAPAWAVSGIVHLGIFGILAALTVASEEVVRRVADLDTALVSTTDASDEQLISYADPSDRTTDQAVGRIDEAVGDPGLSVDTSSGFTERIGSGPASATPSIGGRHAGTPRVGEGTALPSGAGLVRPISPIGMLPTRGMTTDLSGPGGGGVAGDTLFQASDHGVALDQIAREILQHLREHRVTVVWMFDESESMKDDQRVIREKFSRVTKELDVNVEVDDRKNPPLTHAIVGFGSQVHFELEKPTADLALISRTIDRLRVDPSGEEKTNEALRYVISHYAPIVSKDHRLLIVLVTDESGDDGGFVEETLQTVRSKAVPIYVIGRQSPFGYPFVRHRYVDPVTGDVYWPTIRRGPESAGVESLQWDGLHDRWEEQASGFAPFELARLTKESGGIFFLLPSEEEMRAHRQEKSYDSKALREYVPAYESRATYDARRLKSDLRRTLGEVVEGTRAFGYRRHYPIDLAGFVDAARSEIPNVRSRQKTLHDIELTLERLRRARDLEPERRWKAHYDLILAQVVAYQIMAEEYIAALEEMIAKFPKPKAAPTPEIRVEWIIDHDKTPRAPTKLTEKKYAQAKRLLEKVIEEHPRTPWADLARLELDRGFSVGWSEWRSNPRYEERAKLVPKY